LPVVDDLNQHPNALGPQPLSHRAAGFLVALCASIQPQTNAEQDSAAVIVKDFLTYAPAFPGIPNPQQHIREPPPPPPHISITTVPACPPGGHHLKILGVTDVAGVYTHIFPCSKSFSDGPTMVSFFVLTNVLNDVGISFSD
jgi:hypothetical protein